MKKMDAKTKQWSFGVVRTGDDIAVSGFVDVIDIGSIISGKLPNVCNKTLPNPFYILNLVLF